MLKFVYMSVIALTCASCRTLPTISTDAITIVRADIVRSHEMTEPEALRVYRETGKYRGLTDDEWTTLMIIIEAIEQRERELIEEERLNGN